MFFRIILENIQFFQFSEKNNSNYMPINDKFIQRETDFCYKNAIKNECQGKCDAAQKLLLSIRIFDAFFYADKNCKNDRS